MKIHPAIKAALLLIASMVVFFIYTDVENTGIHDGDSPTHYLLSRGALQYPELFLDHWGKPFFILITTWVSQFGFKALQLFNVLLGAITAWLTFRIGRRLDIAYAWLIPGMLIFMPIYLVHLPTGLTEPLFSLVLAASIWLFLNKRFVACAVLVSFLPFVRSEGFLLLPLFFIALVSVREYKAGLLLSVGTILYSIIGLFALGDLLWLFHKNPYTGAAMYGHGTWYHFFEGYQGIVGKPTGFAWLAGIIWFLWYYSAGRKREAPRLHGIAEVWLIYGCCLVYLFAHVIFWWQGMAGSAGMQRVLAAVAPCIALMAMRGLSWAMQLLYLRFLKTLAALAFITYVIYFPVDYLNLPMGADERLILVREAAKWTEEHYPGHKLYFTHPMVRLPMNMPPNINDDPHAQSLVGKVPGHGKYVILWDSQFGPNEAYTPLERITSTPGIKLVKKFDPPFEIGVPGGGQYVIYIFEMDS